LAHVIVSKYENHLPLYRQERIFARHGLELPRSTLCDWILQAADLLAPLRKKLEQKILMSPKIHTDDSPILVQVDNGKNIQNT
jgi:transposase